ncbi:MAG: N-acetylmuramic acid 6-phosphate etherase [Nitratireductor sp.]|nr:N-acetylmuramic acid 6-phosphate etherase [Nitratireductor sp.]
MPSTMPQQQAPLAIDALSRGDALSAMLASHLAAVGAVAVAQAEIDRAAEWVCAALTAGKTLYYAAAGSSGLMALADASELAGTFGIPTQQVRVRMAGGVPADGVMPGDTEDDAGDGIAAAREMQPGDVAIVVSASGTTPYAVGFAETAREQGNGVVAIANVAGSRLFQCADVAIAIPTAAEVVEGSTRLGAATAQKVALNMISTQAGILLGHVHDGMMVNLIADNAKLRQRASGIVRRIARVPQAAAEAALSASGHDAKLAVLLACGVDIDRARERLARAGGRLRDCLPGRNGET